MGAAKTKHKAIQTWGTLWYIINNRKEKNLSVNVRNTLYNWILHHPQVVQYPVANDRLKVYIGGHS